jgi:hypothetical protein
MKAGCHVHQDAKNEASDHARQTERAMTDDQEHDPSDL